MKEIHIKSKMECKRNRTNVSMVFQVYRSWFCRFIYETAYAHPQKIEKTPTERKTISNDCIMCNGNANFDVVWMDLLVMDFKNRRSSIPVAYFHVTFFLFIVLLRLNTISIFLFAGDSKGVVNSSSHQSALFFYVVQIPADNLSMEGNCCAKTFVWCLRFVKLLSGCI